MPLVTRTAWRRQLHDIELLRSAQQVSQSLSSYDGYVVQLPGVHTWPEYPGHSAVLVVLETQRSMARLTSCLFNDRLRLHGNAHASPCRKSSMRHHHCPSKPTMECNTAAALSIRTSASASTGSTSSTTFSSGESSVCVPCHLQKDPT